MLNFIYGTIWTWLWQFLIKRRLIFTRQIILKCSESNRCNLNCKHNWQNKDYFYYLWLTLTDNMVEYHSDAIPCEIFRIPDISDIPMVSIENHSFPLFYFSHFVFSLIGNWLKTINFSGKKVVYFLVGASIRSFKRMKHWKLNSLFFW